MRKLRVAITLPDFIGRLAGSISQFCCRARLGPACRLIPLTQGKFAIVDDDDYLRLIKHNWYAVKFRRHWYAARYCSDPQSPAHRKPLLMHRQLLQQPDDIYIDHINGNGLDNRKINLRPATKIQNAWNRKKKRGSCSSSFKGVSLRKNSRKWRAKISCRGKTFNLGYFHDEIDAAKAYDAKARELHGPFAKTNFP